MVILIVGNILLIYCVRVGNDVVIDILICNFCCFGLVVDYVN